MRLPPALEDALGDAFSATSLAGIAGDAARLRSAYRTRGTHAGDERDFLAYAASRLPGTFAAIAATFAELSERFPDLEPASLLDLGTGPGTAAWAAAATWPGIRRLRLVDRDSRMIALGKSLAASSGDPAISEAIWEEGDLARSSGYPEADIVTCAYALSELAPAARERAVRAAWRSTRHSLCIIEPAKSPRGTEVVRDAARLLEKLGASLVAPWTDTAHYLLPGGRWLHAAQRVERSRVQRLAKRGTRSYEDEKFSYVIASRALATPYAARVTLQPKASSGLVRLELLTAQGLREIAISRRHPAAYRLARKLRWGEALPPDSPILAQAD